MATMRDVRRRIRTVRNIQEITKALKMVAAARLQKAESRTKAARPYAEEMALVMGHLALALRETEVSHPLLEAREPVSLGILVITSDRGMAGSYNTNVIRRVSEIAAEWGREQVSLIAVGRKGRAFFARQGYRVSAGFEMPSSEVGIAEARHISRIIQSGFEDGEFDEVRAVYTRFHSAISQRVTDEKLLPVAPTAVQPRDGHLAALLGARDVAPVQQGVDSGYIFEPAPERLLAHLLPRYVDVQVYHAMMEALASEHGARMTAMSTATDNARELIERLTLDYNRARQAAITRELIEIVSGAEALK